MKLNFGRRLVLFVHWLMSLALCALVVAICVWSELRDALPRLIQEASRVDVLAFLIAILVVYLLFSAGTVGIIFGGRKRGKDHGFIVVDSSETGRTRIAVGAVEQMIRQAVRGVGGIADMKAGIVNGEDAIAINVDVAIRNGAHVPTVTANIQRAIRGYIEQNCGVAVRGVAVSVHALADVEVSGKRGRKKKTEAGSYENPTPVGYAPGGYGAPERSAEPETVAQSSYAPEYAPKPEGAEPEPALTEDSEPIALTLDPPSEPAQAPEAAPDSPGAPAQKKGLFGKFFGKRGEPAPEAVPEANAVAEVAAEEAAVDSSAEAPADGADAAEENAGED